METCETEGSPSFRMAFDSFNGYTLMFQCTATLRDDIYKFLP